VGGGKLCRRLLADIEKLAGLRVVAPGGLAPRGPATVENDVRPEVPAPEKDGTEAHD
jgi:hypothetical protein